jgi:hypothetical protein
MLPWLVLGATLVAVVVLETLRTPDWRAELEAYVATQVVTGTLTVQSVVEAEQPWHFEAAMGQAVSPFVEEIPYPPQKVRCVLLGSSRV